MTQNATSPLFALLLVDAPSEGLDVPRDVIHKLFTSKARALEEVMRYLGSKLPSQGDLSNDPEILRIAFGDTFTEEQMASIADAVARDDEALTKALLALPIENQEVAADEAFDHMNGDGQLAQYMISRVEAET